jgi:hypothetical protein
MEIQKLTIQKLTIAGKKYEYPDTTALVGKINELVDAVNEIMTWRFETDEDSDWYDDPKHREQPANPYEEQLKWIGKLCKFWDYDGEEKWFSTLEHIDKNSPYPYCASGDWWYKHCEPVLPTDNAIYKGGDNE